MLNRHGAVGFLVLRIERKNHSSENHCLFALIGTCASIRSALFFVKSVLYWLFVNTTLKFLSNAEAATVIQTKTFFLRRGELRPVQTLSTKIYIRFWNLWRKLKHLLLHLFLPNGENLWNRFDCDPMTFKIISVLWTGHSFVPLKTAQIHRSVRFCNN